MTHIDINWLCNGSLKKLECIARRFCISCIQVWISARKYLKADLKNSFLTLCSFFSHFSGSTIIPLWIWNGIPSWPTSTLYSNPTDCDTVSPTPSIPWIFREIINMASHRYWLPFETASTVGTVLFPQGQIGLGFASTHVARCWNKLERLPRLRINKNIVYSGPSCFMIKQHVTKETVPIS